MNQWKRTAVRLLIFMAMVPMAIFGVHAQTQADALVRDGIRLHGQRDFDGAIQLYRRALEADPQHGVAQYELTFSLFAKGDCASAVEAAVHGTSLPGTPRQQAQFWSLIGSCKDRLGDPQGGIAAFQRSIALDPANFLTHFNFGVTYARLGQGEAAAASLLRGIKLEPGHASSHFVLSRVLHADGQHAASLLALLRFLSLEPTTPRAAGEMARLDALFAAGLRRDSSGKPQIAVNQKTMERDVVMSVLELGMALVEAKLESRRTEGADAADIRVERVHEMLKLISEQARGATPSEDPVGRMYLPFFLGLGDPALAQAFPHWVLASTRAPATRAWVPAHPVEWSQLMQWLRTQRAQVQMPVQN